jgi:hypothetical protein
VLAAVVGLPLPLYVEQPADAGDHEDDASHGEHPP